ncbi:MAG: hypothetical protein P8P30_07025 [Rickettsiales bacterium]|nr:hypothetical protein [Rickettsiales bacterium]
MNEFTGSTVEDIIDISSDLFQQSRSSQNLEISSDAEATVNDQAILDAYAGFESQVFQLFEDVFSKAKELFESGDMAQFHFDVAAAKESYFELRVSLSIEVTILIPVEVPEPQLPTLTQQALSTVGNASISDRDKEALISMIAMIDEFVKTAAHDHLMRSVILIVPLMEQITPETEDFSVMLMGQMESLYWSERSEMRESTGVIAENYRRDDKSFIAYSMSMQVQTQTRVSFRTEA